MALVDLERRDRVAIVTMDNPPVNVLTRNGRASLLDAIGAVEADPGVEGIVLRGAGRTFIAGADIRELDRGPRPPHTPDVVARIESLDKPVAAAIDGSALGGGLEIALGCHLRVATTDARLGFPEVRLGLIPGATGTQRLPRLVGIERALDLMISGRPIGAARAHELGMVDAVVPPPALLEAAIERVLALAASGEPLPRIRERDLESADAAFFEAYRDRLAGRARGQIAPGCILRSVENATRLPYDEAVRAERALFLRCLASEQSRAMRYAFFAERDASKPPEAAAEVPAISSVAVIGAGTMGAGIAFSLLAAGYEVVLHDVDPKSLTAGRGRIEALAAEAVAEGRVEPEQGRAQLTKLAASTELRAAADADLVIEAAYENLALKRQIFAELDAICRRGALLATNTSTLDVDSIASAACRPEDVLGLHFFSPAHVMRLIEIVRGRRTSARAITAASMLARSLGKISVVVGNAPGFVGNRMFHAYGREAQSLLLEGAAPEQIDRALEDWGMAMGPHAVGDLAGLDVGYKTRRERRHEPADPRYFRVADALVEAGRYGQKTGLGMYRYLPGSRERVSDPAVAELIEHEARALGIARRDITAEEIVERCIYALIIEGVRVLEARIARSASDIDVVWLNGYGFPRYRGGPMFYADSVGLDKVCARLSELSAQLGARDWRPPELLAELARNGRRLSAATESASART